MQIVLFYLQEDVYSMRYLSLILTLTICISVIMASNEKLIKTELGDPIQQLTLDFLRHMPKDENLFFSPLSITSALSMANLGADEETSMQIMNTLKFAKGTDGVHNAFKQYHELLKKEDQPYSLKVADRVYPSNSYDISAEFLKKCLEIFSVTIQAVDFDKAEEVRMEINKWVESQTNEKIKDLLPSGAINELTKMVLVDAVYFKGNWKSQFRKDLTTKMQFRSGKKPVEVDMMYQKANFKYKKNQASQFAALELPYVGDSLSMLILLPDADDGQDRLEKSLTADVMDAMLYSMPEMKVAVWIPKFKLQCAKQLSKILSSLGMSDAFSKDKANFSKMDPSNRLFIDEVYHQAFVEVNEEGTEAAAATAVVMRKKRSVQIVPEFKADRPFLFFIKDVENGVILFAGRVLDPSTAGFTGKDEL